MIMNFERESERERCLHWRCFKKYHSAFLKLWWITHKGIHVKQYMSDNQFFDLSFIIFLLKLQFADTRYFYIRNRNTWNMFSYLMILHCILFMHLTHRDFLFIWYEICQNYAITRDFEVYVTFSSSSE